MLPTSAAIPFAPVALAADEVVLKLALEFVAAVRTLQFDRANQLIGSLGAIGVQQLVAALQDEPDLSTVKSSSIGITYNSSDVDRAFSLHESPLHIASEEGHTQIVDILTRAQPDLTEASNECGGNPLHCAVRRGQKEVVRVLAQANSPLVGRRYAIFAGNLSPLDLAVSLKAMDLMTILLAACPTAIDTLDSSDMRGIDWQRIPLALVCTLRDRSKNNEVNILLVNIIANCFKNFVRGLSAAQRAKDGSFPLGRYGNSDIFEPHTLELISLYL